MYLPGEVVANLADIARLQAPALACHRRSRHLPAGQNFGGDHFDLGIELREVRQSDEGIDRIEPYAHDVNHRRCRWFVHVASVHRWSMRT